MFHAIGQNSTGQHSTHKEMECYEYYIKCRHVSQMAAARAPSFLIARPAASRLLVKA